MDETSPRGPTDTEDSGFTRLDLARHSLVVLAHSLGPADTLCIISFSSTSNVVFETSLMDEAARSRALAAIAAMRAGGGTNMWQGLQAAMAHATARADSAHILLLTDGCATDEPSGGLAAAFAGLSGACAGPVALHTLGFGYGINSELLQALATSAGGVFAFVPDASMIGTVFVNILSTVLATAHVRAQLVFTADTRPSSGKMGKAVWDWMVGAKGNPNPTALGFKSDATGVVDIGLLQHSQTRTLTLNIPAGWQGRVVLQSCTWQGPQPLAECSLHVTSEACAPDIRTQAREATILAISEALEKQHVTDRAMRQLHAALCRMATAATGDADTVAAVQALAADAWSTEEDRGQLGHAVATKAAAERWGRHYLRSQLRAHRLQFCLNFRDAGLQAYAAPLFAAMQARVESLFCTLPAPAPTGQPQSGCAAHAPTTMASYYTTSCG